MEHKITELEKKDFPPLLKEIHDCPSRLFLQGSLPGEDTKLLAVVGSRRYSEYGRDVCEKLISELAGLDVAIVSGLALGIDSIAHLAALKNNIKTIAIPGSGLNREVLYPSSHRDLAKKIVDSGGALLSPFENDQKALPFTFPKRNTIIAGMSHGVLVIEAEKRSGTLITARLGMEYNREVMTVPASIYSRNGEGSNELIKVGATPVTGVDDILEGIQIEKADVENLETPELSGTEKSLYELLSEPRSKEEVLSEISIPPEELSMVISAMEIKGLIKESLGKIHRA